ncbi:hypothetical protein ABNX05_22070 [Lysinibacillus sp. M3]|uniref:Uncharacterized protein n=1 Tax=Lysinibacillus zambalensis TaxID=3160866 RepID=A0ABV1MXS2_9BACI
MGLLFLIDIWSGIGLFVIALGMLIVIICLYLNIYIERLIKKEFRKAFEG